MSSRAVFFDRDGVLNRLVLNPATGEYESPHKVEDLELTPGLGPLLGPLAEAGFMFFLVSNQPSAAKGKASLDALLQIHAALDQGLRAQGIVFNDYLYCYHHPQSRDPLLGQACECRKPEPGLLLRVMDQHKVVAATSWMLGDQDSDIEAGQRAGVRTVLIETAESGLKRGLSSPDHTVPDLKAAVAKVLEHA